MTKQWRYRCPRGHSSWLSRSSGTNQSRADYYCISCQKSHGDGAFDELVDMKNPADHHLADPEVTAV